MQVDPDIKVLPIYQLLVAFVRLTAILIILLTLGLAAADLIGECMILGFTIEHFFDTLVSVWLVSRSIGLLMFAVTLWFFARPIALFCTPQIRLDHCQVCGYNLKGDTQKPCSECGHMPQTEQQRVAEGTDGE